MTSTISVGIDCWSNINGEEEGLGLDKQSE